MKYNLSKKKYLNKGKQLFKQNKSKSHKRNKKNLALMFANLFNKIKKKWLTNKLHNSQVKLQIRKIDHVNLKLRKHLLLKNQIFQWWVSNKIFFKENMIQMKKNNYNQKKYLIHRLILKVIEPFQIITHNKMKDLKIALETLQLENHILQKSPRKCTLKKLVVKKIRLIFLET